MLSNSKILITGGTGSFGKAFVERALSYKVKKIVILNSQPIEFGDTLIIFE